jgi:hypothetical protein
MVRERDTFTFTLANAITPRNSCVACMQALGSFLKDGDLGSLAALSTIGDPRDLMRGPIRRSPCECGRSRRGPIE